MNIIQPILTISHYSKPSKILSKFKSVRYMFRWESYKTSSLGNHPIGHVV